MAPQVVALRPGKEGKAILKSDRPVEVYVEHLGRVQWGAGERAEPGEVGRGTAPMARNGSPEEEDAGVDEGPITMEELSPEGHEQQGPGPVRHPGGGLGSAGGQPTAIVGHI